MIKEALTHMKRANDNGHEIAAYDALSACHDWKLRVPGWAVKTIMDDKRHSLRGEKLRRKLGRHARLPERQRQLLFDGNCFEWVKDFRESTTMNWTEVFERTGKHLNLSADAIRKAYSRAKRRYAKGDYYFSPENW